MSKQQPPAKATAVRTNSSVGVAPYIVGFVLSVGMTLVAYVAVQAHGLPRRVAIVTVAGLAVAQFLAQFAFFLHLGREERPRWKLVMLLFALGVVAIVVLGSLWIMNNLNSHTTTSPAQVNKYLNSQDGL